MGVGVVVERMCVVDWVGFEGVGLSGCGVSVDVDGVVVEWWVYCVDCGCWSGFGGVLVGMVV